MEYQFEMDIYGHSMAMRPQETKKGKITLADRPMIGEEIEVEGQWHKIATIRHSSTGMVLKLEDYYPNPR